MFLGPFTSFQYSHPPPPKTLHWTHGSSLLNRASAAWELSWKKHPSTNAGSVKRSDKCSKAQFPINMNYKSCQELWLHDITSSSLLLLKSKHGYLMCRWAVPHNLLCSMICVLMDAHRLWQSKSFHPMESHKLCKQLLLGFDVVNELKWMIPDFWSGFVCSEMRSLLISFLLQRL